MFDIIVIDTPGYKIYRTEEYPMNEANIEIELPPGWRATAFRLPKRGEYYLNSNNGVSRIVHAKSDSNSRLHIIVIQDETWDKLANELAKLFVDGTYFAIDYCSCSEEQTWYAYSSKPVMEDDDDGDITWSQESEPYILSQCTSFTMPEVEVEESLFQLTNSTIVFQNGE